jgi:hypothetical protein
MTTLQVGENQAYKTIGAALEAAAPGDVVEVESGMYQEAVIASVPGVALVAAAGARPVIDGGYGPHLFGDVDYTTANGAAIRAGQLPALTEANARRGRWVYNGSLNTKGYSAAVKLTADGTRLAGFTIRNIPGRAIVIDGDGCEATGNRIDFTYGGAIGVATGCVNVRVADNVVTRSSIKYYDPTREGAGPGRVQTTIICGGTDVTVEGNTVAYCEGEGISADKAAVRPVIRGNVIHTCRHWALGVNGSEGAIIEGNVVYWCDNLHSVFDKANPADLLVIGNELGDTDPRKATTRNLIVRDNVLAGGKRPFLIGGAGRPVQFVDTEICNNTIIGRVTPGTERPTFTWSCMKAMPHDSAAVTENVVLWEPAAPGISYQPGGNVTWAANVWGGLPPAGMRGENDAVADGLILHNPFAPIIGAFDVYAPDMPDVATTFDLDNYRPLAGSVADGRGALLPLVAEPPPDPPEPDYDWLIAALEGNLEKLEAAGLAVGAAVLDAHELIDLLKLKAG